MRRFYIQLIILLCNISLFAQGFYQGPAKGEVLEGHTFNTNTVSLVKPEVNIRMKFFAHEKARFNPPADRDEPLAEYGSNFVLDPSYKSLSKTNASEPFILHEYEGPDLGTDGRYLRIPPDAYVAAGPDHVVTHINSLIFILDKSSGEQTRIDPMNMFNYIESISPFDPKISYDHFDQRWVSVWLHVNDIDSESFYLIAVSDDADPNGVWFTWALPSNVNGRTPAGNWADFQGVGFDREAVYLTSNQWEFGGGFNYVKLRIIDKSDIYVDQNPGRVSWRDIWDIYYPGVNGLPAVGLRPSIMQDDDEYYYLTALRYGGGNTVGLFRLREAVSNPVLTAFSVPTVTYQNTAGINVKQPGDKEFPLEHGDLALRFESVFVNNKIHLVHPSKYETRIGVRYLCISTETKSTVADLLLGTPEHYYLYPGLAVNQSDDVVITYSRVSANEYAGAYFTFIPSGLNTFTGSRILEEGNASYEVYLNDPDKRNRYGDYNGAWVDPVDPNTFWIFTEYIKREDTWGTRLGAVRYRGFDDPYLNIASREIDFGTAKLDSRGKIRFLEVINFGNTDLVISEANLDNNRFELAEPSLPITVSALDTLSIGFKYTPKTHNEESEGNVELTTNDPNNSSVSVSLSGKGFEMVEATKDLFYASTGNVVGSLGRIASVDKNTGETTVIDKSGFRPVSSLTMNPVTNELYALNQQNTGNPNILMVRGNDVQAMLYDKAPLDIKTFTFDNNGLLHVITEEDDYYTMDPVSLHYDFIASLDIGVSSVTCNYSNNVLYLMRSDDISFTEFYSLSSTGQVSLIGETGLSKPIVAMTFDAEGTLYGSMGNTNDFSVLVSINTSNGSGIEIGNMGLREVLGLAYAVDGITGITREEEIPAEFVLEQNYPNPFNPSTSINFSLPASGSVNLTLYNSLGQRISTLIDKHLPPGKYSFELNTADVGNLSSGTYIYELQLLTNDQKKYSTSKKMILLK